MAQPALAVPPILREGDRLNSTEFLHRWEAMPDLKRAELINETVFFMASPVGSLHGDLHIITGCFLTLYRANTPGTSSRSDVTWVMGPRDVPQPDLTLFIRPDHGGATRVEKDRMHGVPDLIVEVTHTTSSRDLGIKLALYQTIGVPEYLTILIEKQTAIWRRFEGDCYREIKPGRDGILKSHSFPGLWLNTKALFASDEAGVLATLNQGLASPEHTAFVRSLAARKK
jgi:Uma2 family endonuclease